jgi:hypothetical protein
MCAAAGGKRGPPKAERRGRSLSGQCPRAVAWVRGQRVREGLFRSVASSDGRQLVTGPNCEMTLFGVGPRGPLRVLV